MTAAPEEGVRPMPPVHVLPLADLRESAENPRRIPERAVELLALSLQRFGWKQPLVVDRDRELIVGHTRFRAARSLGLTSAPVIYADDLTPEEVSAYRIADNRTHDFTTWDLTALSPLLDELSGEFADVLALTDWESVNADLEKITADADLTLPRQVGHALDGGFVINVHFHTKEEALEAQATIIDLPGVFDVRHNF
jgi:ParB-like chromosome segregation protein Spo0J